MKELNQAATYVNMALLAEEVRIQKALLELGYYAYRIQFQPMNSANGKPHLYIEARGGGKGDQELINRSEELIKSIV